MAPRSRRPRPSDDSPSMHHREALALELALDRAHVVDLRQGFARRPARLRRARLETL